MTNPSDQRAGQPSSDSELSPRKVDGMERETLLHTDEGGDLVVQGGPRPYLWIGGRDNRCVGTVETDLRALRDAITQALRHADREAMADA